MNSRIYQSTALILLVLLALTAHGVTAAAAKDKSPIAPEVSFASPEEGIAYIVDALRQADLGMALQAFAIDRRVADYSFVGMAERLNAIALPNGAPPVTFEFYQDIAAAQFTNEAALQLRNLTYSLLAPEGTMLDRMITTSSPDETVQLAAALETAFDPARLAGLEVVDISQPFLEMATSEAYRRGVTNQLAVTGGDDLREYMVLYRLEGRTFRGGATLVQYGERWQVRSLHSNLLGTSASGLIEPEPAGQ